jgi:transposase
MYRELQALLRHHDALERTRQQERNRLQAAAHPASVRSSLEALLAYLDQALETVEQRIRAHLAAHPELQRQRELLLSIPGIGAATARWLLAERAGGTKFRRAVQAAAYVGVEPRGEESGTWKGKTRLSKQGNARLRAALYFPALAGLRCNPVLQALAARLRAAGKCPMVIVGAAMRKLVHLAFGVLHQGKAFDPAWGQRATTAG